MHNAKANTAAICKHRAERGYTINIALVLGGCVLVFGGGATKRVYALKPDRMW